MSALWATGHSRQSKFGFCCRRPPNTLSFRRKLSEGSRNIDRHGALPPIGDVRGLKGQIIPCEEATRGSCPPARSGEATARRLAALAV